MFFHGTHFFNGKGHYVDIIKGRFDSSNIKLLGLGKKNSFSVDSIPGLDSLIVNEVGVLTGT